jgi:hypothetical protein
LNSKLIEIFGVLGFDFEETPQEKSEENTSNNKAENNYELNKYQNEILLEQLY